MFVVKFPQGPVWSHAPPRLREGGHENVFRRKQRNVGKRVLNERGEMGGASKCGKMGNPHKRGEMGTPHKRGKMGGGLTQKRHFFFEKCFDNIHLIAGFGRKRKLDMCEGSATLNHPVLCQKFSTKVDLFHCRLQNTAF